MPTFRTTILTVFLLCAIIGCAAAIVVCRVSVKTVSDNKVQMATTGVWGEPSSEDATFFMTKTMALFTEMAATSALVMFLATGTRLPSSGWLVAWTLGLAALLLFLHYDRYQPLGGHVLYGSSSGESRASHPTIGMVVSTWWAIDVAAAWLFPGGSRVITGSRVMLHLVVSLCTAWVLSTLPFVMAHDAILWSALVAIVTMALLPKAEPMIESAGG